MLALRLYKTPTLEKKFVIQTPWNLAGIYKKVHSVDLANKYEKRLLPRCIHHFKPDLINNMDHMRISGNGIESPRENSRVLYF